MQISSNMYLSLDRTLTLQCILLIWNKYLINSRKPRRSPVWDPVSKGEVIMLWWFDGTEENTDDLPSNMFLVLEIAIEWRLGDPGLDNFVGDSSAVRLVGEPGGVSLGVVLSDENRRPWGMPWLETRYMTNNKERKINMQATSLCDPDTRRRWKKCIPSVSMEPPSSETELPISNGRLCADVGFEVLCAASSSSGEKKEKNHTKCPLTVLKPNYIDYKPTKCANYSARPRIYTSNFCKSPSMVDPVEKLASLTCPDTALGALTCYGNTNFVNNNILWDWLSNPQI